MIYSILSAAVDRWHTATVAVSEGHLGLHCQRGVSSSSLDSCGVCHVCRIGAAGFFPGNSISMRLVCADRHSGYHNDCDWITCVHR